MNVQRDYPKLDIRFLNGIPEFVHIRNQWELQEFLVIPAYSGITKMNQSAK